jgi:hypothetical protein
MSRIRGPAVGVAWRLAYGSLKSRPRCGMIFGGNALEMGKASQYCLVGGERFWIAVTNRFAHIVGQNAVDICDRRNNSGNHIVLKSEEFVRVKAMIIGFRPEMSARDRVDELHRDPSMEPNARILPSNT